MENNTNPDQLDTQWISRSGSYLHHGLTVFNDGHKHFCDQFLWKKMIAEHSLESVLHFTCPTLNIDML